MPYANPEDKQAHERLYMSRYRAANRERMRQYGRDWYSRNREKIREIKDAWRTANPEAVARYHRNAGYKKRHGITAAEVDARIAVQDGKCALCGLVETLVLDHNHTTNQKRGMLCNNCNLALGHLKDNPALCVQAAEYLKRFE